MTCLAIFLRACKTEVLTTISTALNTLHSTQPFKPTPNMLEHTTQDPIRFQTDSQVTLSGKLASWLSVEKSNLISVPSWTTRSPKPVDHARILVSPKWAICPVFKQYSASLDFSGWYILKYLSCPSHHQLRCALSIWCNPKCMSKKSYPPRPQEYTVPTGGQAGLFFWSNLLKLNSGIFFFHGGSISFKYIINIWQCSSTFLKQQQQNHRGQGKPLQKTAFHLNLINLECW